MNSSSNFASGFGQSSSGFGLATPFGSSTLGASQGNNPSFGAVSSPFQPSSMPVIQITSDTSSGFNNPGGTNPVFGNSAALSGSPAFGTSTSVFGSNSSSFGSTGSSGFGNSGSTAFGSTGPAGFGNVGSAGFGSTGSAGFGNIGSAGFGNTGSAGFGSSTGFSTNSFGSGSSGFTSSTNVFGTGNSDFGSSGSNPLNFTASQSGFGSGFGSGSQSAIAFGTSTNAVPFGNNTNTTSSFGTSSNPVFGAPGSGFGTSAVSSVFGTNMSSAFSGNKTSSSAFGTSSAGQSSRGTSVFGSSKSGSVLGTTKSNSATSQFGDNAFNTSGFGSSGFGSSSSSVFGGFGTGVTSGFNSRSAATSGSSVFGSRSSLEQASRGFGAARGSSIFGTGSAPVFSTPSTTSVFGSGPGSGFHAASHTGFGATANTYKFGTESSTSTSLGTGSGAPSRVPVFVSSTPDSAFSTGNTVNAAQNSCIFCIAPSTVTSAPSVFSGMQGGFGTVQSIQMSETSAKVDDIPNKAFGSGNLPGTTLVSTVPSATSSVKQESQSMTSGKNSGVLFTTQHTNPGGSNVQSSVGQNVSMRASAQDASQKSFPSAGKNFTDSHHGERTELDSAKPESSAFSVSKNQKGFLSGKLTGSSSVFGGKREHASSAASSIFGGQSNSGATFQFSTKASSATTAASSINKSETEQTAEGVVQPKRVRFARQEGGKQKGSKDSSSSPSFSGPRNVRRSSSFDNISNKTSILCKNIPTTLNKNSILRTHFLRFGRVKRVVVIPAKKSAVITFETHEAANSAKEKGTVLMPDVPPMEIYWRTSASERSPTSPPAESSQKPNVADAPQSKKVSKKSNISGKVAEELASMGGSSSTASESNYFLLERPATKKKSQENQTRSQKISRRTSPTPSASSSIVAKQSKIEKIETSLPTLASLKKAVATTTSEKIAILDNRDKLLRQVLGRQSGSVDSKAFKGTCPDMCPEKERLYREDVRRLSVYEIIPGSSSHALQVDHSRAVKEYSRSSADQDEPLPHELRPLPVLIMTMNYLLVQIMNCGEDGKWAEWYDFLWNRTRGIRKDITQQQLCSLEVVELIEKCVRFHIYCSERLCSEDMMVFDQKINNENLTKCLQTLKELYADMENKHSTLCPNEAEFRAYIVLMNLNEGDTLREVQQLRPDVRNSKEIAFAVKAYSALNSNNYVRFFRLVRQASFLDACILHRYFNQVRARTLQIMIRAYNTSRYKVMFPLSEIIRLLAFENETQAREFCAYYGQMTDGLELALDRTTYMEPEGSVPFWRAQGLVESKCLATVGEIINGGQLQAIQLPSPQCSFDAQGRFIGSLEGIPAAASSSEMFKPSTAVVLQQSMSSESVSGLAVPTATISTSTLSDRDFNVNARDTQPSYSNEAVKSIARELFWEVIDQMVLEMTRDLHAFIQVFMSAQTQIAEILVSETVFQMTRDVCQEVINEGKLVQQQQLEADRKDREERITLELWDSIFTNAVRDELLQIANSELSIAKAVDKAERIERCTSMLCQTILEEVSVEMVKNIASNFHALEVVARLQWLSELQQVLELRRTSQWFLMWRKQFAGRQRLKRIMLDFPSAPSMHTTEQTLHDLLPDRPEHSFAILPSNAALLINKRAKLSLLSPLDSERLSLALTAHLSLASLLKNLQRTRAWQPLKLGSSISKPLTDCARHWPLDLQRAANSYGIQWKLLVSVPEDDISEEKDENSEENLMKTLKQWLLAKFSVGDIIPQKSLPGIWSLYSIYPRSQKGSMELIPKISICVRCAEESFISSCSVKPSYDSSVVKGTTAILFLLPHANTSNEMQWLESRLRLANLLKAKPMLPPVPIVFLLPCQAGDIINTASITSQLGLEWFIEQCQVSEVAVVELPLKADVPDVAVISQVLQAQMMEAVSWLATRYPEPPVLTWSTLGDLVENMLTEHFFTPVLQDLKTRQELDKLHQAPNILIGLYNTILDHIGLQLTSETLQDISWPVPEFCQADSLKEGFPSADWNNKSYLVEIYQLLTKLRLPWFHYGDPSKADWNQVCTDVWVFISEVVGKSCTSTVTLASRISCVLARTCLEFENICILTENEDHCLPTYVNAPWTDIIITCIEFRLECLHHSMSNDSEVAVGTDSLVCYQGEEMAEFEPPASWIQAQLESEEKGDVGLKDTILQAVVSGQEDSYLCDNVQTDIIEDTNNSCTEMPSSLDSSQTDMVTLDAEGIQTESMKKALDVSGNLLLHLQEEKQKIKEFEHYLQRALQGSTAISASEDIFSEPFQTSRECQFGFLFKTPENMKENMRDKTLQQKISPHSKAAPAVPFTAWPKKQFALEQSSLAINKTWHYEEEEENVGEIWHSNKLLLSESIHELAENLQSQKSASKLFEKRLQFHLNR